MPANSTHRTDTSQALALVALLQLPGAPRLTWHVDPNFEGLLGTTAEDDAREAIAWFERRIGAVTVDRLRIQGANGPRVQVHLRASWMDVPLDLRLSSDAAVYPGLVTTEAVAA
jgi:hypothetical protein